MMEINRTNYEAYFIDYLEGNLDEGIIDSFITFLKVNPDLKKELELYEPILLEPDKVAFNNKTELYKSRFDTDESFNHTAIALLEEDLTEEEKLDFENYLVSHPGKEKQAVTFRNTKLKADENIVFTAKKKLYKKAPGKTILLWTSRVAAVLVLGLVILNLVNRSDTVNEISSPQIAEVEKTPQKTIEETPVLLPENDAQTVVASTIETATPAPVEEINSKKPVFRNIVEENNVTPTTYDFLAIREKLVIPEKLNAITTSINVEKNNTTMATMYITLPAENYHNEVLLADRFKEKINLRMISKVGLDLISSISDDRFEYETNINGKVVNYTYESRLLAFSIPGKNEATE